MTNIVNYSGKYRVWAEIDLKRIVENYRVAEACAPGSLVMPVVKANAYGHGAVRTARALSRAGAKAFAVMCPEEAVELRDSDITQPVLLLGDAPVETVEELARNDITVAITSLDHAKAYSAALANARGGLVVNAHVKLDSGMHRSGLDIAANLKKAAGDLRTIMDMQSIKTIGVFTHLATADEGPGDPSTARQIELFENFCAMHAGGLTRHIANSAGILDHPRSHACAVRPGIMLYGYDPRQNAFHPSLRPAMSVRTAIRQIRRVHEGEGVSYGLTWRAPGERLIATVSAGYADGLMRCLSGRFNMLVRGRKAPQVGRVCMDMCMLDVTDVPNVEPGDVATILGVDGDLKIDARDMGKLIPTIPYEILCAYSSRVKRLYVD